MKADPRIEKVVLSVPIKRRTWFQDGYARICRIVSGGYTVQVYGGGYRQEALVITSLSFAEFNEMLVDVSIS